MAIKKSSKEIISFVLIIVSLFIALYYSLQVERCPDAACFREKMLKCREATYVNEEPQASWGYHIIGKDEEKCNIEVTLLNAKEGELKLLDYEGKSMTCSYDYNTFAYPEKDLEACHGELKEGVQSIIIEKLYKYIISNLGNIAEQLRNTSTIIGA